MGKEISIAKTIFYHECPQPTNRPTIHHGSGGVGGEGGGKTILTNRFADVNLSSKSIFHFQNEILIKIKTIFTGLF